jgi:hypothetical protein
MRPFTKTIHVFAVGLWFGMSIFFTFPVALSLIHAFEAEAAKSDKDRPAWLPLPAQFDKDPEKWIVPDSEKPLFKNAEEVRKEQGVRAFGAAVGPLFDWYFLLQGVCGLVALAAALYWSRAEPTVKAHRLRVLVLLLALITVVAGWPLERYVSVLRVARSQNTDEVLKRAPDIPESVYHDAVAARQTFAAWHTVSLLLNFSTIALVTVAMALAARLPSTHQAPG